MSASDIRDLVWAGIQGLAYCGLAFTFLGALALAVVWTARKLIGRPT